MKIACAYDEIVPLVNLVAHPLNTNNHPEKQIQLLSDIISYQGQRSPIVVSIRSGFITKGHGRLEAIKLLGWESAAVDYQEYDNEAQELADMEADNRISELAERDEMKFQSVVLKKLPNDFNLGLLGAPDIKRLEVEVLEPKCDEDEVPEIPEEPNTKRGDIYQLGNHRLMCGDSTVIDDVERLIEGNHARLCFTSPPYSDMRDYSGEIELSVDHISTFIRASYSFVDYFSVNLGINRKNGEINCYWDAYIKEARLCGLKLLSWNVWDKGECGSIGNQTAMFGISHEWIFIFGREKKELNRTILNKSAGTFKGHSAKRNKNGEIVKFKNKNMTIEEFSQMKTVYKCTPQKARDEISHPARFSIEFAEGYIEAMTKEEDIIYEPFGGSGSTLIACEKTNRKCLIMEIDNKYCDTIINRWEKYTGKQAVLINNRS